MTCEGLLFPLVPFLPVIQMIIPIRHQMIIPIRHQMIIWILDPQECRPRRNSVQMIIEFFLIIWTVFP